MNRFALARANTGTSDLPGKAGSTTQLYIYSTRTKLVNGKKGTPERELMTYSYGYNTWVRASWVAAPDYDDRWLVTLQAIDDNLTGAPRSYTLKFNQNGSGKTIYLTVTQAVSGTYEFETSLVSNTVLFTGAGSSANFNVTSRLVPGNNPQEFTVNVPDWILVTRGGWNDGVQQVTLSAKYNDTGAQRKATVSLIQKDTQQTILIDVTQGIPLVDTDITLTLNWPSGTQTGAFFLDGEIPIEGGSSLAYFSMSILDDKSTHTYKKSVGIRVNMSAAGESTEALPGDQVACYRYSGGRWNRVGMFTLPSVDTTITL